MKRIDANIDKSRQVISAIEVSMKLNIQDDINPYVSMYKVRFKNFLKNNEIC